MKKVLLACALLCAAGGLIVAETINDIEADQTVFGVGYFSRNSTTAKTTLYVDNIVVSNSASLAGLVATTTGVAGNFTVGTNLTVSGTATISNGVVAKADVTVGGDAYVSDTLTVSNSVVVSTNLTVGGAATVTGSLYGNVVGVDNGSKTGYFERVGNALNWVEDNGGTLVTNAVVADVTS